MTTQFELRGIGELAPYERNSRVHAPKQVKAIQRSIEQFGFVAGAIVIRNGTLAKGHATLQAVKQIIEDGGLLYPGPGKRYKAKPFPPNTVPVQDCSAWSEEEFKTQVIFDNRIAEIAAWNKIMVAEELPEIVEEDLTELLAELKIDEIVEVANLGGRFDYGNVAGREATENHSEDEEGGGGGAETSRERGMDYPAYPVTFILTKAEWQEWLRFKTAFPKVSQKDAFLKGIELT